MSSPPSGAVSPANIELEDQPVRLEAGLAGPEKDLHAGGELPAGGDDSPESDLSTAADESAPENGETPTDEEIGQVVSKLSGLEAYNETIKNLEPPPDGGWEAWLVVAAGVFTCALGGGSDWAFGVFQRYYTQSGVFPGADNKTIALIGSVSGGLFGIVGLFAGRLTDTWGPRKVIMVGAVCYVLGYLLASFSTEVWQLFLTQGVLKGIGGGFQYMGPLSVLPQWFSKKRGLATGIMVSGVGLGGFAFAYSTQAMLDRFGHQWTLRILAFIAAALFCFIIFAVRIRFPLLKGAPLLDLSKLKLKRFWIAAGALFWIQMGFFTLTYFTPSYSTIVLGIPANDAANLVAYLNIFSFSGRIIQGFISDQSLGSANTFFLCVFCAALCDLVYWPFSKTWASQMGLMALYGLMGGGYASMLPVTLVLAFGTSQIGTTLGMVYLFFVPGGMVGPIIAGAIIDSQTKISPEGIKTVNFLPVQMWGGLTLLMGAFFTLWLRFDLAKGKIFLRI